MLLAAAPAQTPVDFAFNEVLKFSLLPNSGDPVDAVNHEVPDEAFVMYYTMTFENTEPVTAGSVVLTAQLPAGLTTGPITISPVKTCTLNSFTRIVNCGIGLADPNESFLFTVEATPTATACPTTWTTCRTATCCASPPTAGCWRPRPA